MSHYMTALAMQQRGLKPAAKIVLYWLADHHNQQTGLCFPSLSTLVDECEMDRSTVIKHLKSLERDGLIRKEHRTRDNGSITSNAYTLLLRERTTEKAASSNKTASGETPPPLVEISHPPSGETPPPLVEISHPHNLGNNNLGNEQEDGDRDAAAPTSLTDLEGTAPAEPQKPKSPPKIVGGLYDGCRSLDQEFERVWVQHPRKVGKGAARSAWGRARSKASFEEIARPLAVWIKLQAGSEPSFICHFSTWLNEERWLDDQTHALNRRQTTSDRLRRLGASTEAGDDTLAGPRTPPQIELRMDP
jgi:DNA-binding MarR family transcriptional regulator